MKTIKFEGAAPAPIRANNSVIRISGEMYAALSRLSLLTRQPIASIANTLLAEALGSVELVEVPLYNMNMKTEEE